MYIYIFWKIKGLAGEHTVGIWPFRYTPHSQDGGNASESCLPTAIKQQKKKKRQHKRFKLFKAVNVCIFLLRVSKKVILA